MPDTTPWMYRVLSWTMIYSASAAVATRSFDLQWSVQGALLVARLQASQTIVASGARNFVWGPHGGEVVGPGTEIIPVNILLSPGDSLAMATTSFQAGDSASILPLVVQRVPFC